MNNERIIKYLGRGALTFALGLGGCGSLEQVQQNLPPVPPATCREGWKHAAIDTPNNVYAGCVNPKVEAEIRKVLRGHPCHDPGQYDGGSTQGIDSEDAFEGVYYDKPHCRD